MTALHPRKTLTALLATALVAGGLSAFADNGTTSLPVRSANAGEAAQHRNWTRVAEIGFRNRTYDRLKQLYGYDWLYPQAFAIDRRMGELFILRGAGTGQNRWGWIEVYDLAKLTLKTTFSTSEQWREGLVIKREGGRRYLYTIGHSSVIRFDITRLPADLSVQRPERQFVRAFSMIAAHGEGFVVQERPGAQGPLGKQVFGLYDAAFGKNGHVEVALAADLAQTIPGGKAKLQSIASDGRRFYAGYGAAYVPGVSKQTDDKWQGTAVIDAAGRMVSASLLHPDDMAEELRRVLDYVPTCVENEGVVADNGVTYSLWITLGPRQRESAEFAGKGIVVMRDSGPSPAAARPRHP